VRHLLDQLEKEQREFPFTLVVVDDRYDDYSSDWLRTRLSGWLDTQLVVNPSNLGYLKSINSVVSKVKTKFCLLLNSDVEINTNGIQRITTALTEPGVALATALATDSGANLSVRIPRGRHWIEIDHWLQGVKPIYPDAHTAIGYAMAINLELVDRMELFSTDYIDGYGEDSDLHFRVIEKGHRSVIADNVLVRHHSGMSYETKNTLSSIKKANMDTFLRKWGALHAKQLRKWESSNPLYKVNGFIQRTHKLEKMDANFLILIPSLQDNSGGSRLVVELFEQLWRAGRTARILPSVGGVKTSLAWTPVSEHQTRGSKIDNVISTGAGTFADSHRLSANFKSKKILFFQGPEMFFENGGHFKATLDHLSKIDLAICNSPYIEQLARTFEVKSTIVIPLGPDIDRYYRDERSQKTNKVLISSRSNIDKATVLSIPLAISFLNLGYKVETFGFTIDAYKQVKGIKHHGHVSPMEMNRLMNESKFLIDTSIFEGLGLTPLEALAAHCIPVVTRKGGLESTNPPKDWMLWLDSPYISQDELTKLIHEMEVKPNRSIPELEAWLGNNNQTLGISASVTALEAY
jgi:glycosyltransferase involved in cell wall biosynthesis